MACPYKNDYNDLLQDLKSYQQRQVPYHQPCIAYDQENITSTYAPDNCEVSYQYHNGQQQIEANIQYNNVPQKNYSMPHSFNYGPFQYPRPPFCTNNYTPFHNSYLENVALSLYQQQRASYEQQNNFIQSSNAAQYKGTPQYLSSTTSTLSEVIEKVELNPTPIIAQNDLHSSFAQQQQETNNQSSVKYSCNTNSNQRQQTPLIQSNVSANIATIETLQNIASQTRPFSIMLSKSDRNSEIGQIQHESNQKLDGHIYQPNENICYQKNTTSGGSSIPNQSSWIENRHIFLPNPSKHKFKSNYLPDVCQSNQSFEQQNPLERFSTFENSPTMVNKINMYKNNETSVENPTKGPLYSRVPYFLPNTAKPPSESSTLLVLSNTSKLPAPFSTQVNRRIINHLNASSETCRTESYTSDNLNLPPVLDMLVSNKPKLSSSDIAISAFDVFRSRGDCLSNYIGAPERNEILKLPKWEGNTQNIPTYINFQSELKDINMIKKETKVSNQDTTLEKPNTTKQAAFTESTLKILLGVPEKRDSDVSPYSLDS